MMLQDFEEGVNDSQLPRDSLNESIHLFKVLTFWSGSLGVLFPRSVKHNQFPSKISQSDQCDLAWFKACGGLL